MSTAAVPALRLEWRDPKELKENPANWRRHPPDQVKALSDLVGDVGWAGAALFNEKTGRLIDGHLRRSVAVTSGQKIPVLVGSWSEEEERKILATLDPVGLMASADAERLQALLMTVTVDDEALGSVLEELSRIAPGEKGERPEREPSPFDKAEEYQQKWGVKRGDLFAVGRHVLMCGDSTSPTDFAKLCGEITPDLVLTDPPYCSGGFQEAGRSAGSVGRRGDFTVANDSLSTRGYVALISAVLQVGRPSFGYLFTDWRMWNTVFDTVEASGMGVRSMIVWDKGTPGMGMGWRSQHEIICWAARAKPKWDRHDPCKGNVIQAKRTGNVHHATEKPVELLEDLLRIAHFAKTVWDPFAGSAGTLIAAARLERKAFGMELVPEVMAVALERLEVEGLEPKRA